MKTHFWPHIESHKTLWNGFTADFKRTPWKSDTVLLNHNRDSLSLDFPNHAINHFNEIWVLKTQILFQRVLLKME